MFSPGTHVNPPGVKRMMNLAVLWSVHISFFVIFVFFAFFTFNSTNGFFMAVRLTLMIHYLCHVILRLQKLV